MNMKYVIVYWSRYGNNKRIAGALAEQLKGKGETQVFTTDEANPTALPSADVYVFSAPTEAFNIQKNMRTFLKQLQGMDGKKYGIINTHGMKKNWLPKMEKILSKKNMEKIAGVDFQVTSKDEKTGNPLLVDWEGRLKEFAGKL
ncbi:MAG: flavodoxin family protein [Candidatus Thermoplasmatota archaeon]|nr:flavodoxin family protein [Candidatus Thermoplasmatota archaeon]